MGKLKLWSHEVSLISHRKTAFWLLSVAPPAVKNGKKPLSNLKSRVTKEPTLNVAKGTVLGITDM
jgi:hypothetical protein